MVETLGWRAYAIPMLTLATAYCGRQNRPSHIRLTVASLEHGHRTGRCRAFVNLCDDGTPNDTERPLSAPDQRPLTSPAVTTRAGCAGIVVADT